jgi:hypothetical protein
MSNPLSAAVGRVTASVATVHNENSLSLANLNFDFTLVKLAPPKEYDGLGASISAKRKADAEDGELHRTARKLGAPNPLRTVYFRRLTAPYYYR